jgi:hypothetical protein
MKQSVTWVNPKLLKRNKVVNGLYSIPENYETIKENIALVGILTPLHVVRNVVVSGNLRLQIALELGFDVVPVIYVPKQKISEKLLAVSYGQQRVKKYSEILKEYEILEASFPIGKGKRTDLNPEIKKNVEKRKQLDISKAKLVLLKGIKVMAKELYGEGTEAYKDVIGGHIDACMDFFGDLRDPVNTHIIGTTGSKVLKPGVPRFVDLGIKGMDKASVPFMFIAPVQFSDTVALEINEIFLKAEKGERASNVLKMAHVSRDAEYRTKDELAKWQAGVVNFYRTLSKGIVLE